MAWAKFSDDFYENPKAISFSDAAFRLYVAAITFCHRKGRRDGFIRISEATVIGRLHGIQELDQVTGELVAKEAWHTEGSEDPSYPSGAGWTIHDFEEYLSPDHRPTPRDFGRRGGLASARARVAKNGTAQPLPRSRSGERSPKPPEPYSKGPKPPEAPLTQYPIPVNLSPTEKESSSGDDVGAFLAIWSRHRGGLPAVLAKPRPERARLIGKAMQSAGPEQLAAAIALAATDPHYAEHGYGVDTFCRHVDRWLELAAAGRTSMAAVAAAPKPLPENPIDRRIREGRLAMAGGAS